MMSHRRCCCSCGCGFCCWRVRALLCAGRREEGLERVCWFGVLQGAVGAELVAGASPCVYCVYINRVDLFGWWRQAGVGMVWCLVMLCFGGRELCVCVFV